MPGAGTFSDLVRDRGWDRLFPPIMPAWARLGPVRPELAATTGLPSDCMVVSGIHDSNASLLRHLPGRRDAFTVVSTGAWVVVLSVGASVSMLDERRDMLANIDALGRPVAGARFMGGREYAEILGGTTAERPACPSDLAAVVSRGEMALSSLAAQGGPFAGRPGRFVGEPPARTAERAALAALYCALVTEHCLGLLDTDGDVVVEGAFATNAVYSGVLAALLKGRRVLVSEEETGTVPGCAALVRWPDPLPPPSLRLVPPLETAGLTDYAARWRAAAGRPWLRRPDNDMLFQDVVTDISQSALSIE